MKRLLIMFIMFWTFNFTIYAQMMSGGNGQSPSSEVKASAVTAGGVSGDVNLFSGTFNSGYSIGAVSTPSGLSFGLSLSYSSTISAGDNLPQSTGIPYGEGWNIDVPTLSISTEDYNKYTLDQTFLMSNSPGSNPYNCGGGNPYTSDCNGSSSPTSIYFNNNNCDDAEKEGRLYWFAPSLNIPGIASGRLVYKQQEGEDYVFVLHTFERYIEARLRKETTSPYLEYWTIITDDGTQYELKALSVSNRNASNQRVQRECTTDKENLRNLLLPKSEILTWYCNKITHPNKAGEIVFDYEKLGAFNFLPIFSQYSGDSSGDQISEYFYNNTENKKNLATTYRDILLKSIDSGYEKIDLDYNNILESGFDPLLIDKGYALLNPNESGVMPFDNMYSSKAIKSWYTFEDWYRYYHLKSSDITGNEDCSGSNTITPNNPYQGILNVPFLNAYQEMIREHPTDFGPTHFTQNMADSEEDAEYKTGYLESPRIGASGSGVEMLPGETYELKWMIDRDEGASDQLFDINLATGDVSYDGSGTTVSAECYNRSHGESVFSTFGQGLKYADNSNTNPEYSNLFVMPNLPNQFEGFSVQIGPASSDNNFNYMISPGGSPSVPPTNLSFFNVDGLTDNDGVGYPYCNEGDSNANILMKSGSQPPANFGIGMPWFMLDGFYRDLVILQDYTTPGGAFWFNPRNGCPGVIPTWENQPTMINDKVKLFSAKVIRYAKNPYMLTSAKKWVKNKDGGWVVVNNLAFKYDVEKVRRYVNSKHGEDANCNLNTISDYTSTYRNVFLLTDIRQLPLSSSSFDDAPEAPTTNFHYSDIGEWDDDFVGWDPLDNENNIHNTNFKVLDQIIDPLGKETSITYLPLSNELFGLNSNGSISGSYTLLSMIYRDRPWRRPNSSPGSAPGCSSNPIIKQADPYAYQVYMVVDQKTVKNGDGPNDELVWTYDFGESGTYNDHPKLENNFSWDYLLKQKAGFATAQVTGPGLASSIYTHSTDRLLWGKLYDVVNNDINGNTISRTHIEYNDETVAFDKLWENDSENPDFEATDRMHDVPYFYETEYADIIEGNGGDPDYLKSFFIKKTSETTWTYDSFGESISSQTDYEYYDDVSSPGYAAMGIDELTKEPSFQLYSTNSYSPDLGGAFAKTENFYLHDLLNLPGYSVSSMELLGRMDAMNILNLPFETRTTTLSPGDDIHIQSNYFLYTTEVEDRIYLKKSAMQSAPGSGDLLGFEGSSMEPVFPFPTLVSSTIHSWNEFGQPELVENAKGLQTKTIYNNIGLVRNQRVGYGEDGELFTQYGYHPDNRLFFVMDPNGLLTRYQYDDYGRLSTLGRNGNTVESYEYSNWNGSTAGFFNRAQENYVSSTVYVSPGSGTTSTSYVDPLGRNLANVSAGIRRDYKVYDEWSRPIVQLKPEVFGNLSNTVNPDDAPEHAEFNFEAAPRSTVIKSSKFGESIYGDHVVEVESKIVSAAEMIGALTEANQSNTPIGSKFIRTTTTDEDGNIVVEFSNAIGQKVASITNDNTSPTYNDKAATVFHYGSKGNAIRTYNPLEQISEYRYNYFGQLFGKETVDAAATSYGYNAYGELIAEQDGNYSRVYAYDNFGRMISQSSAQSLNDLLENEGMYWVDFLDDLEAFDALHQDVVDAAASTREIEWFYDTYDDARWNDYTVNAQEYLTNSLDDTKGKLVQTVSYDLEGSPIEFKFFSYNNDGFVKWEMMQFMGNATDKGYLTRVDYPEYNLLGSPLKKQIDLNGDHTLDFQYKMEYDNQNRLVASFVSYDDSDGNDGHKMVQYTYDDVRQVVETKRYFASGEDCAEQDIDAFTYAYDDRHRLTSISSNFFSETLFYDGDLNQDYTSGATTNYNGNINAITCNYNLGNTTNAPDQLFDGGTNYNYTYDHLNRLVNADASVLLDGSIAPNLGDAQYSYDKASNIQNLNRWVLNDQNQTINDQYEYNYDGSSNRLNSVDHQDGTRNFTYDANGNLLTDDGKGIASTNYGRANLPWNISIDDTNDNIQEVSYLYDAADSRIFKNTTNGEEYYLRSADGQEFAVFDMTQGMVTWYVHGNERVAKIVDQQEAGTEFTEENSDTPFEPCPPCDQGPEPPQDQCGEIEPERRGYIDLRNRMGETQVNDALFPAMLQRVKLCESRELNTLQRELDDVEVSYEVLQSIEIEYPDQVFTLERSSGELQVNVSLSEMLNIRQEDERTAINGYDPDNVSTPDSGGKGGKGPKDPFDCELEEEEDPPIPAAGYYVHDHLGNTRIHYGVDCDAGEFVYTLNHVVDYLPYGKVLREYVPAGPEKFLTTGHERDVETGLDYRGARFYDADVARFLSLDPLAADFADVSAYNYVLGNPVSLVDPDGKEPEPPKKETREISFKVYKGIIKTEKTSKYFGLSKSTKTSFTKMFKEVGTLRVKQNFYTYQGDDGEFGTDDDYTVPGEVSQTLLETKGGIGANVNLVVSKSLEYQDDDGENSVDVSFSMTLSSGTTTSSSSTSTGTKLNVGNLILGTFSHTETQTSTTTPDVEYASAVVKFSTSSGSGVVTEQENTYHDIIDLDNPGKGHPTNYFKIQVFSGTYTESTDPD